MRGKGHTVISIYDDLWNWVLDMAEALQPNILSWSQLVICLRIENLIGIDDWEFCFHLFFGVAGCIGSLKCF